MDSQDDEVRRKKIDTAIKFLQNARVRQTPMAQRKAFLEKKGLTEEEIAEAIEKSGTAADEHTLPALPPPNVPQGSHPSQLAVYQQAAPVPWHRLLGAAIVGGGMSYGIVHLFKTFVLPLIYHKKSEEEEKLDRIETSMSEIRGSVVDTVSGVQNTLDAVQKLLREQQKQIQSLSVELATSQAKTPSDSHAVGELKSELLSLKGLLLSRKQFPSPVIGSTPGAASIPTWQRAAATSAQFANPGATPFTSTTNPKPPTGPAALSEKTKAENRAAAQQSFDPSSMNGELPNGVDLKQKSETPARLEIGGCQSDESGCDSSTPSTVKSLNEARVEDSLNVSESDTSLSSLSDLSGNPSFHEASIGFSSTCVKIPSNQTQNCEPESFLSDSVVPASEDEAI